MARKARTTPAGDDRLVGAHRTRLVHPARRHAAGIAAVAREAVLDDAAR